MGLDILSQRQVSLINVIHMIVNALCFIRLIIQNQECGKEEYQLQRNKSRKRYPGKIYQQRIVFIECVQVALVGDRNSNEESTFVSL